MEFNRILLAGLAMVFLLAGTTAQAAMLQPVSGQVMVNQGDGYRTIDNPIQLRPGDSIIINPGGVANLNYSDGCTVQVKAGSVVTIGGQSPCAVQGQQGQMLQTQIAAPPVEPLPPGEPLPPLEPAAAAGAGGGTGTLVVVGLGLAAAAGLAVALSSGGSSSKKSASP